MLRNLLLGTAALALAFAAGPARAQLLPGDVEIEGPMSNIVIHDPPKTEATPQGSRTYVGEMNVLGVNVRVLEGAFIHTPTNNSRTLTLAAFGEGAPALPGRSSNGFVGGTAIVVGESIDGQVYASDVFSDLFEHVVVGEATGVTRESDGSPRTLTVNGMRVVPIPASETRMPSTPEINGFGLPIRPNSIARGSLVAAEGYLAGNTLYYHTLEADNATLARPNATQVSVLRADCRIRGGGRDEIEVRGGVANPPNATVQIRIPSPTVNNPDRFTSIGTVTATPDPAAPPQGLYRADFRNLTLPGGVCPTLVRAVIPAGGPGVVNAAQATADMEGR